MDGTALIYCEGALGTPPGRTANNLLVAGERYEVLGVIDSAQAGREVVEVVRGARLRVPIFASFAEALARLERAPDYLVVGLRTSCPLQLPRGFREVIRTAIRLGISVDSAHRPYLHDDAEFPQLVMQGRAQLRSVGYPPRLSQLHAYTGRLATVAADRIALTGTTAPVGGKNLTSILLTEALRARGVSAELIGTSVESWFQGARYNVILDSIVQSHVAGELEHVMLRAVEERNPRALVLEGQGSLLSAENPAGLALLTTARPTVLLLQHAIRHEELARDDLYGAAALGRHIRAVEAVAGARVAAVVLTATEDGPGRREEAARFLHAAFRRPVVDVLPDRAQALAEIVGRALSGRNATALPLTAAAPEMRPAFEEVPGRRRRSAHA